MKEKELQLKEVSLLYLHHINLRSFSYTIKKNE
jgi:hypothetical protein